MLALHPEIRFKVQPSKVRIFSDKEYEDAGAIIDEDLTDCVLILGVKEVPVKEIVPNTTYLIFPHVIKVATTVRRRSRTTWRCWTSSSGRTCG